MASKKVKVSLTQITSTDTEVFGLDKCGRVWKYVPTHEGKNHYSFWTRLTANGSMYVTEEEKLTFDLVETFESIGSKALH